MSPLRIRRPDDFHVHLRDGNSMVSLAQVSTIYKRFLVMPNIMPEPVTTVEKAIAYKKRIESSLPSGSDLQLLMTLYLTDRTTPEEIERARESGLVYACKYYPAGATTNSDKGVTDIHNVYPVLRKMAELHMPLCIHSEATDPSIDIFDREAAFVESTLKPLHADLPDLKIIMEHITTKQGVDFVLNGGPNVGGTITPQHLMYNRNNLLVGGLKPHFYCLPILKREEHRQALLEAVKSGCNRLFLGTDSAPHARENKECKKGCAGCFSEFISLELYAEKHLHRKMCIDKMSLRENGADFYGLPRNEEYVELREEEWSVPMNYEFGDSVVVPLKAGEKLKWKCYHSNYSVCYRIPF
ncbi:dihydroorotase [Blastocystis sp. subtype 4]|uniref:dihydroorotase n=1 Tax=Blastocystis sp. subtype 4 TaxID=944170 RepID=UPI00071139E4|nr:dihydroorotase [Blastocystis sp. subtype 4]KNB44043.1 dihydroorotase [Blastocystis sp. subtype 4]|eukprot:XP_014527480.1 dihydroorotase [Blastocystis sp. subtype 4]